MAALPESLPDDPSDETIEFIFDYARTLPELQNKDWEAMETKAVQVLTAASFIVGLASLGTLGGLQALQGAMFGLGISAYVFTLYNVYQAIHIRDIARSRQVEWLWEKREWPAAQLKESLIQDIIGAYRSNVGFMREKASFIDRAMTGLGVEAVLILGAIVWTRLG